QPAPASARGAANHSLRTVPPTQAAPYAAAHDEALWDTLLRCLGGSPPDGLAYARDVAGLPAAMGGLGLCSASRVSPAAYWAGWADALTVIQTRRAGFAEARVAELSSPAHGPGPPSLREAEAARAQLQAEGPPLEHVLRLAADAGASRLTDTPWGDRLQTLAARINWRQAATLLDESDLDHQLGGARCATGDRAALKHALEPGRRVLRAEEAAHMRPLTAELLAPGNDDSGTLAADRRPCECQSVKQSSSISAAVGKAVVELLCRQRASAEITTERVLVREMPILFSPVTEKRLILNFNTKHPEWPLLIISEVVERAWVQVAREAVGPDWRRSWLAHTTAVTVDARERPGHVRCFHVGGSLCCDATLVSPLTRSGALQPRQGGGRWNDEALGLVRDLRPAAQRWQRRWWAQLLVAVQQAVGSTALGRAWPASFQGPGLP
ncbi:unnamed protein product, partial [Effrenium voratum]